MACLNARIRSRVVGYQPDNEQAGALLDDKQVVRAAVATEVVAFLSFLCITLLAHPHISREFYVLSGEILPILLLAAIVDRGALAARPSTRGHALTLFASFAMGEAVALAIAGNRKEVITAPVWLGVVVAALAGTVVLLGLRVVGAVQADGRTESDSG